MGGGGAGPPPEPPPQAAIEASRNPAKRRWVFVFVFNGFDASLQLLHIVAKSRIAVDLRLYLSGLWDLCFMVEARKPPHRLRGLRRRFRGDANFKRGACHARKEHGQPSPPLASTSL